MPIKRVNQKKELIEMPNLLQVQLQSFISFLQLDKLKEGEELKNEGLHALLNETFPVEDIHKRFVLEYVGYRIGKPKYEPEECQKKNLTYSVPIFVTLRLIEKNPDTQETIGSPVEEEVYLCDLPFMTEKGTFIVNGVERVIVNQLHRSPGIYFDIEEKGDTTRYIALLVPYRGPWIEFSIDAQKIFGVTFLKRRRFPVSRLLRILGYRTNKDILRFFFGKPKKIKVSELEPSLYYTASEIVIQETGEELFDTATLLDEEAIEKLKEKNIKEVEVYPAETPGLDVILATIRHDRMKTETDALASIYRIIRFIPPKSEEEARFYINEVLFSKTKMEMGSVGRYKLNARLGLNIPEDKKELTIWDLEEIIRRTLKLYLGEEPLDDIDHLGNRRVRRVGELLGAQFKLALTRLARSIKEKMLLEREGKLLPHHLINPRVLSATILSFFTVNRLSQFLEQTNPLSELTHKRRLSAMGPGGLTKETAGFEVRDVHPSHYGRLCPIETPEGQNIGLITSLTTYAQIDEMGFIITPFRKVKNGKVTNEIAYLTPVEEDNVKIAPADTPLDEKGNIIPSIVSVRYKGGYPTVKKEEVEYMDVSPRQIVSPSASLIPFLEHDDANRALMGANMQRQAVPLLVPEAPIVGTGMEEKVAIDTGTVVVAKRSGTVIEADAEKIVIKPDEGEKKLIGEDLDEYNLIKFKKTNQETIMHQFPIVKPGDRVKKGDVIADNLSTNEGELSLGKNLLVAFIPWYGYNFEDAIVISERLVKEDVFTSIHIKELEVSVRETKLGPEEITRDIPNVPEDMIKHLDEDGIVRIGAEVHPDDILVGKITPRGERELTPEERLIRAIFAEKARDVKDTSLRVPPGVSGIVVNVEILTKNIESIPLAKKTIRKRIQAIEEKVTNEVLELEKKIKSVFKEKLLGKKTAKTIKTSKGKIAIKKGNKFTEEFFEKDILSMDFPEEFISDKKTEEILRKYLDEAREKRENLLNYLKTKRKEIELGDELPHGVNMLIKVYIAQKRKIEVGDKLAGRHGNKGVIAKIAPIEDMPFLDDGTPVDIILNPLGVPSRMNIGQILETLLGWAGKKLGKYYACPVFEGFTIEEIQKELKEAGLPENGRVRIRDGRTGEYLDNEVTVGYIYMMKLVHMVEDKIHTRAVGPYSLITQQPLGGKARFGGQRFGEMEVWALEGYGAAYTLQEMLTVKSDDVRGRNRLYQAVIRGEEPPEPSLPVSFDVLVNELRGLCLDIEIETT
uniref:DNA-directed RNA polymerase subunit beta n=2 Tax=candidate division WOR-3 bacterium TaxID=2052148 RepID=A0A7V4E234_UNCW3